MRELRKLAVEVHVGEKVVELRRDSVHTANGRQFRANIAVWAAGVKAPDLLRTLGGADALEVNALNHLVVDGRLRSTRDPNILAFGDCAACPQPGGKWVPPRAQAAYQQAMYLLRTLPARWAGGAVQPEPKPFVFEDQGSLVSLSDYSSVGSLMGSLTRGSLFVEGQLAKIMYWGLHKQHQLALGGFRKTALITLAEMIDRAYRPRIKLH